jgi:hypothetical protein
MFGTRGATWGNVGVTRGNAALHGTSAIFRMDLVGVSERLKATNTVFVAYFVATGCEIICCSIPIHFCRIWQCKIRQNTHETMKRSCHYTWRHCRLHFGGKNHGLIVLYLGNDMPWPIMTLRFFLCFLRCRLTMFRRIRFARPNLSFVLHMLCNFNPFYACDFLPADLFPSHSLTVAQVNPLPSQPDVHVISAVPIASIAGSDLRNWRLWEVDNFSLISPRTPPTLARVSQADGEVKVHAQTLCSSQKVFCSLFFLHILAFLAVLALANGALIGFSEIRCVLILDVSTSHCQSSPSKPNIIGGKKTVWISKNEELMRHAEIVYFDICRVYR